MITWFLILHGHAIHHVPGELTDSERLLLICRHGRSSKCWCIPNFSSSLLWKYFLDTEIQQTHTSYYGFTIHHTTEATDAYRVYLRSRTVLSSWSLTKSTMACLAAFHHYVWNTISVSPRRDSKLKCWGLKQEHPWADRVSRRCSCSPISA